jgi:hypothetical protein
MPADGQPFLDDDAAARADLARERRVDRLHFPTGVCRLVAQDAQEGPPACICDALGEVVILNHVADLQVFVIHGVVLAHERERRLLMKVLPLSPDFLMRLGEQCYGLTPGYPTLRRFQRALGFALPAGSNDARAD